MRVHAFSVSSMILHERLRHLLRDQNLIAGPEIAGRRNKMTGPSFRKRIDSITSSASGLYPWPALNGHGFVNVLLLSCFVNILLLRWPVNVLLFNYGVKQPRDSPRNV